MREVIILRKITKAKYTVISKSAKTAVRDLYNKVLDVISLDPLAAIDLIKQSKALPTTVRDGIFFEAFEAYILNLNDYDSDKKEFIENNLQNMAISLAEVSPNQESGYEGDDVRLHEYSKRIVKLIDDCGTIQKAVYLANISRIFAKHEIDKKDFFKFGQCIRMLTEEDLLFLKENIREGTIDGDGDYIDDFRGLGLMYEVEGGFAYSKRAFRLREYALEYERTVYIPEKFPERQVTMEYTEDEINEIFNEAIDASVKEIV